MSTRRRSTRAAVTRKRAEEKLEETVEEDPAPAPAPAPEPENLDRTSVPAEENPVTETLTSDTSLEKENQVHTMDPNPPKRSKTTAHAQTCESAGRTIPLGKPKSGRVWKDRNKQRFSALLRDKPLRSSWQKKMDAKREKELVKKYHQQIKDQKAQEKQEKRKRREENLKRREENERKAEIVQVIRNTAKLKRMKKKQLRKIEKRDTLSVLQKTPPAVKKAGK